MEGNFPRRWYQFSLRAFLTKRRRFQFTLRTFLILVTLLAICLGYISFRAREQRAAVARINALGGSFQYDNKSSLARWSWLRRFAGDEYLLDVIVVQLDGTKVADDDLRVIGKLRRTKRLVLGGTNISDEGLAAISGMSKLDTLALSKTKVTSEGICRLPLPLGSSVGLGDTRVGDEALPNLSCCARLWLDGTPITSQGLKQLTSSKNLLELSLQRTAIGDEAVPILARFTALQSLNVMDTKISGEGLFSLRNSLPNCRISGAWSDLSFLGTITPRMIERARSKGKTPVRMQPNPRGPEKLIILSGPLITDGHLWLLEQLDRVDLHGAEVLDLRGASVTVEGVEKLQETSPKLKIYR
jgi:hypothetical protein